MKTRCERWIAIDLDDTVLFRDRPEEGTTVATFRDGVPSSRIADDALLLLQTLAEKFSIVPLTSRSAASFRNVNLENVPIDLAGVNHGAQLLVGDTPDRDWAERVRSSMDDWQVRLFGLQPQLNLEAECRLEEIEGIGAVNFRARFRDRERATRIYGQIANDASLAGFVTTIVGTQIHVTPAPVTKGALVEYLSEAFFSGCPPTIAFGDSAADLGMMARARFAATPVGSTLWGRIDG